MITLTKGNIFDADVEALVNPVNCVGVMGKGLALQFKKKYPANFNHYEIACLNGIVRIGFVSAFRENKLIINFPTKVHWKDNSEPLYIKTGLESLITTIDLIKINSVAIPPLGCGLGGLDWNDVKPLIIEAMETLPNVNTVIYEP